MTGTKLYWIDGPWQGKLAIAARPRGGDWLDDEILSWQREGVDVIGSLLTETEELDLDLVDEEARAKARRVNFLRFPIPDRSFPSSDARFSEFLSRLDAELSRGRNVVVHCRQGIGRSALAAAGLLVGKSVEPGVALQRIGVTRGVTVPETSDQLRWINHYATTAVVPHHE
jgi:hypothetical protein